MRHTILIASIFTIVAVSPAARGRAAGERPYELVWANRVEDTRPPVCGFEDAEGWTVQCEQAVASFERSDEQRIWGDRVGKLVYRGTGPRPSVVIRPPRPVPLAVPLDCVNVWVYGNDWAWSPDPSTPPAEVRVLLRGTDDNTVALSMGRVRWKEWWLMHQRLTPDQLRSLGTSPTFVGFEIAHGTNASDRTLYFDNLAVYLESLPPLTFAPRPRRPITLPACQTVGTNSGSEILPFPTREETLLPDILASNYSVTVEASGTETTFREDAIAVLRPLPRQFATGQRLRGDPEKPLDAVSRATVHWTERACGGEPRDCLFMHPPYVGGVGYVFATFEGVQLPDRPAAAFRCDVGKADGSDLGNGMLFRVAVLGEDGSETLVAEKEWTTHAWTPLEADLSRWHGQQVRIKLITDVGPGDDSSGDWGCWSNVRVEGLAPTLTTTWHEGPTELTRQPGPHAATALTLAAVRAASRATLHFEGIGLQRDEPYVSYAGLNDVPLGTIPAAGGNERDGTWSHATIPLTREALESLREWNHVEFRNPGNDSFKVRKFWIELHMNDNRIGSSQVTTTVFSQPADWLHAEGTGLPFGKTIEVDVRMLPKGDSR